MTDSPFYAWSLVEAWNWLANSPFLGFIVLLIAGVFVALFMYAIISEL